VKVTAVHPYLTVEVANAADVQTIILSGEADLLGASSIEAAIGDASSKSSKPIVLDLKGLTFMDSSSLEALIAGHGLCRARGCELRIIPGPENVQRLFELTGVRELLPFIDAPDPDGEVGLATRERATPPRV